MQKEKFKITLRNDYAFKRVLGDKKNKVALIDFLSCVLNIPTNEIKDVQFLDKELNKDTPIEKIGILDIKIRLILKLKNSISIGIEIQNVWEEDFEKRILFYWSKLYTANIFKGIDYTELNRCVIISLIGDGFKLNDEMHSTYKLLEAESHKVLNDDLEIHFLDLAKARKIKKNEVKKTDKKLVNWLKFIETDSEEERMELSRNSQVFKILNETTEYMGNSPEERALYESRMFLKSDIITSNNAHYRRGVKVGLSKAKAETDKAKAETERLRAELSKSNVGMIAKNMKSAGYKLEEISKLTGLDIQDIEELI